MTLRHKVNEYDQILTQPRDLLSALHKNQDENDQLPGSPENSGHFLEDFAEPWGPDTIQCCGDTGSTIAWLKLSETQPLPGCLGLRCCQLATWLCRRMGPKMGMELIHMGLWWIMRLYGYLIIWITMDLWFMDPQYEVIWYSTLLSKITWTHGYPSLDPPGLGRTNPETWAET